jgi:cation diffusion facilitator CzcD-associated flavoprotein CzcO
MSALKIKTVCVIGAGPSGLITAYRLRGAGFDVAILERSTYTAGNWNMARKLSSNVGKAHHCVDKSEFNVSARGEQTTSTPCYANLTTNTPRLSTSFRDFPLDKSLPMHSIGHADICAYLQDFGAKMKLNSLIRFQCDVKHVCWDADMCQWRVSYSYRVGSERGRESRCFDAVAACNGHHNVRVEPRERGIDVDKRFAGALMHSREYIDVRRPVDCRRRNVLIVGGGASGRDIARELAGVADTLVACTRRNAGVALPLGDAERRARFGRDSGNVKIHLKVALQRLAADGMATFDDGSVLPVDVTVMCIGYRHDFSMLSAAECGVRVKKLDRREPSSGYVPRLYRHMLPIDNRVAPNTLALVAITNVMGSLHPVADAQATWWAQVLLGAVAVPPRRDQSADEAQWRKSVKRAKLKYRVADLDPQKYIALLLGEISSSLSE